MAYSAKARLVNELSRSRTTSPHADDYATAASAGSFDMNNDHIINSTVNMGGNTTQQPLPAYATQYQYEPSENGSDGSADMSIELGRGVKRGAREANADISANLIFNLGNDSQYEVTATPPIRPRTTSKKSDDALRRQASLRRATEAARSTDAYKRAPSGTKQRTLSETLAKLNADSDSSFVAKDYTQAPANTRNTRFARSRQTSATEPAQPTRYNAGEAQNGTPRRQSANNPTVQSATYTANSFMLPNLPNITELVSGVRKDGTPVFNRQTKSRSRFTSGTHNPPTQHYLPLDGVPVPDDEKAIFSSLQLLKDKVAELEMANSEYVKRAEEYEDEVIDLRSQLQMAQRRPDSALGSAEEGSARDKWRMEKTRLQASVKALQDRLDRSERKISVSDIAVKRVTKERDGLVTQIGVAYYNNEELKAENETFRDGHATLQAENEDLKDEVIALRGEVQELKGKVEKRNGTVREMRDITREIWNVQDRSPVRQERLVRSSKDELETQPQERQMRQKPFGQAEPEPQEDMATRIAREVRKHREDAVQTARQTQTRRQNQTETQTANHSRSKSAQRQQSTSAQRQTSVSKRTVSAPVETDVSDAESTTELHVTRKTRDTLNSMHLPSPAKSKPQPRQDDSRDITILSYLDPNEVANLRKKLEQELQAKRGKRNVSAPAQVQADDTVRSHILRKSSLKDITAGLTNGTNRFSFNGGAMDEMSKVAKSVRVQSPHTSDGSLLPQQQDDVGDVSFMSNTSRRRRRAASAEGMTSAFILPDITLGGNQPLSSNGAADCIKHNAASCTACHPNDAKIEIPTPVPVTDRDIPQDVDVTSATVRPSQPPPLALNTVIKQLGDEITHLKIQLWEQQRLYNQHDPALSRRKRQIVNDRMHRLNAEIEKRSDQVYALHDVVAGQKHADEEVVEETLMSLGIDPVELAGRVGRKAPLGLDGADEMSEGEDLPWEGLSEYESEEEVRAGGENRRSAAF